MEKIKNEKHQSNEYKKLCEKVFEYSKKQNNEILSDEKFYDLINNFNSNYTKNAISKQVNSTLIKNSESKKETNNQPLINETCYDLVNNFNSNYTEQVNSILKEENNNQPLINSENEPSVFKRKPKLKTRNKNGITKLNISDANPRTNSKTQKINNNKKTEEIKSNIKTEETKSNIKTKSNKTEKINPFYSNHNQAPNKIIPAKIMKNYHYQLIQNLLVL